MTKCEKHLFLYRGKRCPRCRSKSSYEKSFGAILRWLKINFETEVLTTINQHHRFFDFYLPEYDLFVEIDGEQHFKEIRHFKQPLEETRRIDLEKNIWVERNKSNLIRISYAIIKNKIRIVFLLLMAIEQIKLGTKLRPRLDYYEIHSDENIIPFNKI